jgi:hypothetical protein
MPKKLAPVLVVMSAVLLVLTGWTSGSASPAPPRCSAADTRRNALLHVDDPANGQPLYLRYCGPARAVVYLKGKSYRIQGGYCIPPKRSTGTKKPRRRLDGIAIGLITNAPALPGRGVAFFWEPPVARGGPISIDDSEIEVAGTRVAASGTVVVRERLTGGWFSLYGRDGSGPTGPLVSGSWTCGS